MKRILPIIVISQFFCTSLWFAGNAILPDLAKHFNIEANNIAHLVSAVQFGFISGTFVFALSGLVDRFVATRIFFVCSILAALCNISVVILPTTEAILLISRFLTGFFLAGIYPVGMKIASDHYQKGLGKSLGLLVGALVLGTAFPHFLKGFNTNYSWEFVLWATSGLSVLGGSMMLIFVPKGQFSSVSKKIDFKAISNGFKIHNFRSPALGYFGHMWELYTFWAFLPALILSYKNQHYQTDINVAQWSFVIIASGSVACVIGGYLSEYFGMKTVAISALGLSCLCCLISPILLTYANAPALFCFLLFWGMVVIADSPLFSTLVAQNAPVASKGTLLTITNSIGFSLTIISIQFLGLLSSVINTNYLYTFLAIGPLLGIVMLLKKES
ncbi:MFS transporter [Arcicella sp. LKC2W]|uniref:MFS transporter n=1 Tax=Arcicella sp. LKC2W TaxID=2984198 RepID=UPI002B20AB2C|nr:MFS transporter [Arcicella sp. LKC2W]MEA5458410.1 MFS transporter [Arcicella sp. LKC2W]